MSDEEVRTEQPPAPRPGMERGQVIGGVVLVTIGVLLLVAQTVEDVGRFIPLGIGVVLLAAFVVTRAYGFLVPGGILAGVGSGIVLVSDDPTGTRGPLFLVALGFGFISIWVLGLLFRVPENHWWPFIPGGILLAIGTLAFSGSETRQLLEYWPIVLVGAGVVVLAQAFLARSRT
jgi:hypothetical protein